MSDEPHGNSPAPSADASQDLSQLLAGEVVAESLNPAATLAALASSDAVAAAPTEQERLAQSRETLAALAASDSIAADPTAEELLAQSQQALAALAACDSVAADPTDEERLAQRREALAAVSGPRHTQFTYCLCLLLAILGLAQAYFALILSSWALLSCGLLALLVAYGAWQKAHWMQFNLRTALVGMALISLPFAWIGAQVRRYVHEEAAVAKLVEQFQADATRSYEHLPVWFRDACPADWLPVFGPVRTVTIRDTSFGDDQLPLVEVFSALEVLDLGYTDVTDAGVERLARLRALRALSLEGTRLTHKALVPLRLLPSLEQLNVVDTAITNADAREFRKRFPRVQTASGRRRYRPNSRLVGVTPTSHPNVFQGVFEDLTPEIEQELEAQATKAIAQPLPAAEARTPVTGEIVPADVNVVDDDPE